MELAIRQHGFSSSTLRLHLSRSAALLKSYGRPIMRSGYPLLPVGSQRRYATIQGRRPKGGVKRPPRKTSHACRYKNMYNTHARRPQETRAICMYQYIYKGRQRQAREGSRSLTVSSTYMDRNNFGGKPAGTVGCGCDQCLAPAMPRPQPRRGGTGATRAPLCQKSPNTGQAPQGDGPPVPGGRAPGCASGRSHSRHQGSLSRRDSPALRRFRPLGAGPAEDLRARSEARSASTSEWYCSPAARS